jgi:hypothetical protein
MPTAARSVGEGHDDVAEASAAPSLELACALVHDAEASVEEGV